MSDAKATIAARTWSPSSWRSLESLQMASYEAADAPEKILRAAWNDDPRSLDRARFWDADRGRGTARRAGLGDGGGDPGPSS